VTPRFRIIASIDGHYKAHHWMLGRPALGRPRKPACGGMTDPLHPHSRRTVDAESVRLSCPECQMLLEELLQQPQEVQRDLFD
jgi:hypothetical protein